MACTNRAATISLPARLAYFGHASLLAFCTGFIWYGGKLRGRSHDIREDGFAICSVYLLGTTTSGQLADSCE